MFKEKYKRDMDQVAPSPESILKTKGKMMEACVKKPRRSYAKQIVAVAACLLLISGAATFAALHRSANNTNNKYKDLENPYLSKTSVNSNALSDGAKLKYTDNYEEIYNRISSLSSRNNGYLFTDETEKNAANDAYQGNAGAGGAPATGEEKSAAKDYSDTNNQVEGVQEADIVKTDGKYIYACGNTLNDYYYYYCEDYQYCQPRNTDKDKVYILSADNGKLTLASTIAFRSKYDNTRYILREILLYENTLVLIKEGFQYAAPDSSDSNASINMNTSIKYYYASATNRTTSVEIYDITDRANPVFKNELYQSGSYSSSRMIGADLYIISDYYVFSPDEDKPETYIPYCSAYDEKYLVPADCIFIPDTITSSYYNVITGIDVTKPENHKSSVATLGFSGTIYASDKNIYIASYTNAYQRTDNRPATSTDTNNKPSETITDTTDIYRFSINDGVITLAASGQINGILINQFAMDEYKDAFRVAVTVNEYTAEYIKNANGNAVQNIVNHKTYNNLYILDMNLKQTGSIANMAPNERIYSVRFDGEIGYVVTFRQVDPLFAIDLSDVTAPKVLSALKIPGFSTYMHPYGDGLLLGIGLDSGGTNSIKMSMFDITDKTNVAEKTVYKLEAGSYYSEALYNHKAILVNPEKNIIGFPVINYNYHTYTEYYCYKIYKYENNAFKEMASLKLNAQASYSGLRGLYIGDYIYIFSQNQFINSYDMHSFNQIDSYQFN